MQSTNISQMNLKLTLSYRYCGVKVVSELTLFILRHIKDINRYFREKEVLSCVN